MNCCTYNKIRNSNADNLAGFRGTWARAALMIFDFGFMVF